MPSPVRNNEIGQERSLEVRRAAASEHAARAFELCLWNAVFNGAKTYLAHVKYLEEVGLPPPRAQKPGEPEPRWSDTAVKRILARFGKKNAKDLYNGAQPNNWRSPRPEWSSETNAAWFADQQAHDEWWASAGQWVSVTTIKPMRGNRCRLTGATDLDDEGQVIAEPRPGIITVAFTNSKREPWVGTEERDVKAVDLEIYIPPYPPEEAGTHSLRIAAKHFRADNVIKPRTKR